jgi:SAM-dependent methyltransferase
VSALPPTGFDSLVPRLADLGTDEGLTRCCASIYEHPGVRWLLGDELHPGGQAGTLRALELGDVRSGDRLLDVASGRGTSALLAARELGCEVVGLEYGERAVAEANADAATAGLGDRASFRQGDAHALPFGDATFDAVLCECSLCTFTDKRRAAQELSRVLRPGGRAIVCDVVVDRARLPEELGGPLAVLACVGEALSRDGYAQLLVDAGLTLTAVEERNEDAAVLARRVHDRLRGVRLLGLDRMAGAPLAADQAIELVGAARRAIDDGALGYAAFTAEKAPASGG